MMHKLSIVLIGFGWFICALAQPENRIPQLYFCPPQAAWEEEVVVSDEPNLICPDDVLPNANISRQVQLRTGEDTQVFVGGVKAKITSKIENPLKFRVPEGIPGGDQTVEIIYEKEKKAVSEQFGVIGEDIAPHEIFAWFRASEQNISNLSSFQ